MPNLLLRPLGEVDATRTYYGLTAVAAFAFALCFTLNLVFQYRVIGLDPFQMVLVGTVLEATTFRPPLGALASRTSIPVALLVASVVQAPAVAALLRVRNVPPRPSDEPLEAVRQD